jgi:hypothetical protein
VFWLGTAGIMLEVTVVAAVFARHRWAPLAAAVAGVNLAIGYVVVHFLPARSWFSDSFTSAAHVSRLSWAAASLEVAAALTLAIVGCVATTRSKRGVETHQPPRKPAPGWPGALHPIPMLFAVSQIITLITSSRSSRWTSTSLPPFPADHLAISLTHLAALVTFDQSQRRPASPPALRPGPARLGGRTVQPNLRPRRRGRRQRSSRSRP